MSRRATNPIERSGLRGEDVSTEDEEQGAKTGREIRTMSRARQPRLVKIEARASVKKVSTRLRVDVGNFAARSIARPFENLIQNDIVP